LFPANPIARLHRRRTAATGPNGEVHLGRRAMSLTLLAPCIVEGARAQA